MIFFNNRRAAQLISSGDLWGTTRKLFCASAFFCLLFLLVGCEPEQLYPETIRYDLEIPAGFPPMPIPRDNELTQSRVALGEKLFHDPVLSRDGTISCESCHHRENAFADPVAISPGVDGRKGFRNAQVLINLGWNHTFFRDGGVRTLELQVLAPIADHFEMDLTVREAVERLQADPEYVQMSGIAYGRAPDAFVLTRALAAFERTLISGDSPYDQYANGDSNALTAQEIRGLTLFQSPTANCSSCHSGFNFTNFSFASNGLYAQYADSGRARVTLDPQDRGLFAVPTLRNVAETFPYMHDGSVTSLEAVVDHYNSGGSNHPNQSPLVKPLSLSDQDKTDLVAFLHALSDETFLNRE